MLGTLGGSGGAGGGIGGAGEGWGTRSKCLHVIKAVKPSWKGESCVSVCTRGYGHVPLNKGGAEFTRWAVHPSSGAWEGGVSQVLPSSDFSKYSVRPLPRRLGVTRVDLSSPPRAACCQRAGSGVLGGGVS